MDPYTSTWDEQLVTSIFWAPDAQLIMTIPIQEEVVQVLLAGSPAQTTTIIALLWTWWNACNKFRMEQTQINTQALGWQTRCIADEYLEFFGGRKRSQERAITGWTKPEVGILKINSDGSYNKDTLTGGWGYIIRDHEGDVVVTAAGRLHHVHDALQVEAEACIRAIYKAQELGIGNVVMETDASTLVSAIKTSRYDLAPNGNLFQEIKAFASLNFISFDIFHYPRACNKVADALAMHGSKMVLAPQAVWPGLAPTFAQGLVAADYGWRGD
uniref:RNase H type-1 domain-containing protein n=1 Tax=Hordeum vulgare subsp. vulgare TaxID=112509 RepID=A0A8I6Z5L8_HORVV